MGYLENCRIFVPELRRWWTTGSATAVWSWVSPTSASPARIWTGSGSVTSLSEIVRICSELESKNIRIRSVKDNIDTTDYMGKFTMHIFAALAEFERNVIMERTREGREAARKRGKKFGRPQGLNPETQQKVKKAALLYQKGFAVKQICQQIEIKSKSTLYKYLQLENIPLRSFSKN